MIVILFVTIINQNTILRYTSNDILKLYKNTVLRYFIKNWRALFNVCTRF